MACDEEISSISEIKALIDYLFNLHHCDSDWGRNNIFTNNPPAIAILTLSLLINNLLSICFYIYALN